MMSIKRRKKNKIYDTPHIRRKDGYNSSTFFIDQETKTNSVILKQEIKELIDLIGRKEDQLYRDGCLDDICKILEKYLDTQIKNWLESFEHHQLKEKDWLQKDNFELYDLHHSMKVYSNGAAHSLQFFKDELK